MRWTQNGQFSALHSHWRLDSPVGLLELFRIPSMVSLLKLGEALRGGYSFLRVFRPLPHRQDTNGVC